MATPPLILKEQVAPNRTPASQPTLVGLDSAAASRTQVLDLAMRVIAEAAPITAKDIAQRLGEIDARIDRILVNSVLYREGAALVNYDRPQACTARSSLVRPLFRRDTTATNAAWRRTKVPRR